MRHTDHQLDLVCVSYPAAAQLLQVETYPDQHQRGRRRQHDVLAGDGPLAAITAAKLGLRTGVITNRVGG